MEIPHFRYGSVSSTNDVARELLRDLPAVFVSAQYQERGRGRHGRPWIGDHGANIYCSLGLRHLQPLSAQAIPGLIALGAIATWETIIALTDSPTLFLLKFPNDMLGRCPDGSWRKLAGILVEHIAIPNGPASIIGIGINICQTKFPSPLAARSTSLSLLGFNLAPEDVLFPLKQNLEALLSLSSAELFHRWRSLLQIEGRLLTLQGHPGLWRAIALRDDGGLEVEQHGIRIVLTNGDSVQYVFQ
ncbi:MAG: biotin--[acetyl-CoA-carboxylase] ligase [Candidatus Kapabacteria bacterium]|nr:biotin--[acetyl-CoA-carboxylase] ligase [Candidatus Kapabacteria bacterium]MCS7170248.1 biotin--[acetyl-CoA-carboxylase] ligase [Candidatus Kapabacteria bacterium]MDW7996322.1 biotin--[acetyl-CoA-carboxylase] ligase [Bacteroidota bacterium]MDW8224829.1 biotin--[acetyl-CoA-carboxylase] ligase [Bacteroidota bacterium]